MKKKITTYFGRQIKWKTKVKKKSSVLQLWFILWPFVAALKSEEPPPDSPQTTQKRCKKESQWDFSKNKYKTVDLIKLPREAVSADTGQAISK